MTGYQNPPVEHQFKDGHPGGPGKPKGSKNFATILEALLEGESQVIEDGRRLTRKELLAFNLIKLAFAATKEEVKLTASKDIIDRLDGKAKAFTENPNNNLDMTHDEWVKLMNKKVEE